MSFECGYCGLTLDNNSSLQYHIDKDCIEIRKKFDIIIEHDTGFICKGCYKEFSTKGNLTKHMKKCTLIDLKHITNRKDEEIANMVKTICQKDEEIKKYKKNISILEQKIERLPSQLKNIVNDIDKYLIEINRPISKEILETYTDKMTSSNVIGGASISIFIYDIIIRDIPIILSDKSRRYFKYMRVGLHGKHIVVEDIDLDWFFETFFDVFSDRIISLLDNEISSISTDIKFSKLEQTNRQNELWLVRKYVIGAKSKYSNSFITDILSNLYKKLVIDRVQQKICVNST
jgi:hypothetical protein